MDNQGIFKTIGTINAVYKDDKMHIYTYSDVLKTELGEQTHYRIKAVLNDGSVQFSNIKTVKFVPLYDAEIFPNPAVDKIQLSLKNYDGQKVKILIYNSFGILKKQIDIEKASSDPLSIDTENFMDGYYFLRIIAKEKRDVLRKIFIQN